MIRTIWGDPERFKKSYFGDCKVDGKPVYFSGDGAMVDEDGYITITGRTDDVINVSGHRIGTAEIEAGIKKHNNVASVAVVGKPHEIKGEGIFAYVVLKSIPTEHRDETAGEFEMIKEINSILKNEIGAIALCDDMAFVPDLPKTRSGKIMRRILRSIVKGEKITQDTSTLENPDIVEEIEDILNG
jgi:acetyl-CoA synthetase